MSMSTAMPTRASATAQTMWAAVFERFGGPNVVRVTEISTPRPGPKDVLVRVAASTVSAADHRMRARDLPKGLGLLALPVVGLFRPRRRVLGMDFSGIVGAAGAGVSRFTPGDEIVGITGSAFGAHAEFVVLPETAAIAVKPAGLSHEDAAALVFGGHTVSECIRQYAIKPGDSVLVNGASGAVGSAAVQIAKHLGALVTAVTSAGNADLVRHLGADRVVDYTTENFAESGHIYDAIFDCVGNASLDRVDRVLKPGGTLLAVVANLKVLVGAKGQSARSGKRVIPLNFTPAAQDIDFTLRLYREHGLRPVIDRIYELEEIVEAHRHVDSGRKRGSVVLRVAGSTALRHLSV